VQIQTLDSTGTAKDSANALRGVFLPSFVEAVKIYSPGHCLYACTLGPTSTGEAIMKLTRITLVLFAAVTAIGCGGSAPKSNSTAAAVPPSLAGWWEISLTDSSNGQMASFGSPTQGIALVASTCTNTADLTCYANFQGADVPWNISGPFCGGSGLAGSFLLAVTSTGVSLSIDSDGMDAPQVQATGVLGNNNKSMQGTWTVKGGGCGGTWAAVWASQQ